jgi:hypothetical protein
MAVPAGSVEAYTSWGAHGLGSEAFAVGSHGGAYLPQLPALLTQPTPGRRFAGHGRS